MALPTTRDALTGVPVSRATLGEGDYLLPYFTAEALSPDEQLLACTCRRGENTQALVIDLARGSQRQVSHHPSGILDESVAFHGTRNWMFYGAEDGVWWYDLNNGRTERMYDCSGTDYRVKSELSVGKDYVIFTVFEKLEIGHDRRGTSPKGAPLGAVRSFIIAVHIESGVSSVVWADYAYLAHPVIHPQDDSIILYENQGIHERLQELFIIARAERDDRKPLKLYQPYKQRPTYVGHSFFTQDAWVGTQGMQFGGMQPDGSFPDMYAFNGIIRVDGTCDRRARCPGGNKPVHCHSAFADSWWVGDSLPGEGANDAHMICIMKNNWETGYVQAEPFCAHGCTHKRPFHVHPRFNRHERLILFNSNYRGQCHIYIAQTEDFLSKWKDRVSFAPRPARDCMPPSEVVRAPKKGPEA